MAFGIANVERSVRGPGLSLAFLLLLSPACTTRDRDGKGVPRPELPVPYAVINSSPGPDGGSTRVVVIPRTLVTLDGMDALARQLWYDTREERSAIVLVYTDSMAARLRPRALSGALTPVEASLHDRHLVGSYRREKEDNLIDVAPDGAASDSASRYRIVLPRIAAGS